MSIISKSVKFVSTAAGCYLGNKVAEENNLPKKVAIFSGATLGYGVGALVIDTGRAIRNTALRVAAKNIGKVSKAVFEEASEEVIDEVIDVEASE